jgi:hypothetical protein
MTAVVAGTTIATIAGAVMIIVTIAATSHAAGVKASAPVFAATPPSSVFGCAVTAMAEPTP